MVSKYYYPLYIYDLGKITENITDTGKAEGIRLRFWMKWYWIGIALGRILDQIAENAHLLRLTYISESVFGRNRAEWVLFRIYESLYCLWELCRQIEIFLQGFKANIFTLWIISYMCERFNLEEKSLPPSAYFSLPVRILRKGFRPECLFIIFCISWK